MPMPVVKIKDIVLCFVMVLMWALQPSFLGRFKEGSARFLGSLFCFVYKSRAAKARDNMAAIFGSELTSGDQKSLVRQSFIEYWVDIFSLFPSCFERKSLASIDVQGLDNLREAQNQGKGVILWQPAQFGNRNLANQYLHAQGKAVHQVHSVNHIYGKPTLFSERFIKPFFERFERRYVREIIYLTGTSSLAFTRVLADRVQKNALLSLSGDGDVRRKSIPVNFLGNLSHFPAGLFSLANTYGTPVLPVFCFRNEAGSVCLTIESPKYVSYACGRDKGLEEMVSQCVNQLEYYVYKYPGQFRQWHTLYR